MSKIGKKPINIPEGIEAVVRGGFLELKKADQVFNIKKLPYIKLKIEDGSIVFEPDNNSKQSRSNWGTIRALTANAIKGLTQGYEKVLETEGVGFRAAMEGEVLVLSLGFSHPVKVSAPNGIKFSIDKNAIKVAGIDKELVGRIAAEIRMLKKPEPYLGKGIRYRGEIIRRKAGKKAGAK